MNIIHVHVCIFNEVGLVVLPGLDDLPDIVHVPLRAQSISDLSDRHEGPGGARVT